MATIFFLPFTKTITTNFVGFLSDIQTVQASLIAAPFVLIFTLQILGKCSTIPWVFFLFHSHLCMTSYKVLPEVSIQESPSYDDIPRICFEETSSTVLFVYPRKKTIPFSLFHCPNSHTL